MVSLSKKRIKNVFDASLKNVRSGKIADVSSEMLKAGYSDSSSRALKVKQTKTWQVLMNKLDDEIMIDKMNEIILSDDKRSALSAIDMGWKLKDRYPAQKSKIVGLFDTIKGLKEDSPQEGNEM